MAEVIEVAPGAVQLAGWLDRSRQRELVAACRDWSRPPAGMHGITMRNGQPMSVQTVCLGWNWVPYRYTRTAPDGDPVKAFPEWLADWGRQALSDTAYGAWDDRYEPDIAVVNFYADKAKMGLHQDKEERSAAPVVSISLGDSCKFRLGNTENRNKPWTDVLLDSGDVFIFGGPCRLAYHGVPKILTGTGPDDIGLPSGRLNVTLRESGLTD